METENRISFSFDSLVGQIVEGKKTASAVWMHEQGAMDEWDDALQVGNYYTVYDSKRIPRCRIRVTSMRLCRWDDIPDWLWMGEANCNAQEFKDDHREEFNDPGGAFEFVGFEFELLEVIGE